MREGTQEDADAVGDVEESDGQTASTSQQTDAVEADEDVIATADQTPGDPHSDDAGGERVAAHRGEALDDGPSETGAILDRLRCLGDRIQRPQRAGGHRLDCSREDERRDDSQGADAEAAPPANPTSSAGAVLARSTHARELPAWCSSTATIRATWAIHTARDPMSVAAHSLRTSG